MTDDWSDVRLNELADITMGQSPSSEFYNTEGDGLPFFQGCSGFSELYPLVKKYCSQPTRIAYRDDVLMSVRAPVGDLNIADRTCCIGRGLCAIKSKTGDRFVYYLLKANLELIQTYSGGTTYQSINKKEVNNLPFIVPPIPTQRKIAGILSAYDYLIENNTRRIAILEEMAQRIYKEWFVDFRYPGHENDQMVESELGMIPEGWEVKSVGELIGFHIGGDWGKEEAIESINQPVKIIRGTDFNNVRMGGELKTPNRFIKDSSVQSRHLQLGDIVVENSVNANSRCVGKTLLITNDILKRMNKTTICASFCKMFRPKDAKYSPLIHLHMKYLHEEGLMNFYNNVAANGIGNFQSKRFLENEMIAIPKNDEKGNWLLRSLNDLLSTTYSSQIFNLRLTRDHLLPKLISGKVDVSELDIDIGAEA